MKKTMTLKAALSLMAMCTLMATLMLATEPLLALDMQPLKERRTIMVYDVMPNTFTSLDIRDTLNANGGSVGDVSNDYYSDRANINRWAARKPTYNEAYPSSFDFDRIVGTLHYLKYRKPVAPYRSSDYAGYNAKALPCKLNRISVSPTTVTQSGQGVTVFFEWFTGEIDWRVYGATTLRFYLTVDGNIVSGQAKEVSLNNVPVNGIINNSGQEVFQYSFVGSPGDRRTLGVGVSMRDNDGRTFIIDEPGGIVSLTQVVEYQVSYPINIVYTYSGLWSTYRSYVQTLPEVPIASSGAALPDLTVPFNTKDSSIIGKFINAGYIYFMLPTGGSIMYKYASQTPDYAATKVLSYTLVGSFNSWPGVNNPNQYPIRVSS